MSPFELLGLEPDVSAREVKRAYAKLLKQHRPDQDPEGFTRIQEAYQHCLKAIELREATHVDLQSPQLLQSEAPSFPEERAPSIQDPWLGLDPSDHDAVCSRMTEKFSEALQGQIPPAQVNPYLAEDLERSWQVEAIHGLDFDLVVAALQKRDLEILNSCLRICLEGGDFRFALRIAWYWLELMKGQDVEDLLPMGWGLARCLSLAYPYLAENVLGQLFTHDTRARRDGSEELDTLFMLGRILQSLPEEQKLHWSRLMFSDLEPDWFSPFHRSCLDSLARLPQGALAMSLLLRYLGEESGLNPEQAQPPEEPQIVEETFFFEGAGGTCIVIAVILLFLGILLLSSNGGFFF